MQTNNLMKKDFLLRLVLATFLLAGLSFTTQFQTLHAQTTASGGVFSLPTENFVGPAVAVSRLENALIPIKNALENATPGNQAYRDLEAKYDLFNGAMNDILGGKGVAQAILDGMILIGTDKYQLSKQTLMQYRTEIINLLRA